MKIEKETFEHPKVMLCQLSLLFGYEETLTAFASTEWEEVPNNHNLFRTKFIEIDDTATKWVYVALLFDMVEVALLKLPPFDGIDGLVP